MSGERKVPVLRSESSLIEQEFDSIRDKFEAEMAKMEAEMARFRTQLIASERERLVSSVSTSSSTSSRSTTTTTRTGSRSTGVAQQTNSRQQQDEQHLRASKQSSSLQSVRTSTGNNKQSQEQTQEQEQPEQRLNWLGELSSPLIHEAEEGGKVLRLRFDVTAYEPEQIVVKTIDNRLKIHARREERGENMSSYREYNREFLLPDGTEPELIKSSLSADGVLTVEAPLPSWAAGAQQPRELQQQQQQQTLV